MCRVLLKKVEYAMQISFSLPDNQFITDSPEEAALIAMSFWISASVKVSPNTRKPQMNWKQI